MQPQDFSLIKVSEVMRRQVYTVDKDASVVEAAKKMSSLNIGAIVVTDKDGKVIGIFTERDLMNRVVVQGKDPAVTLISEVMTVGPKALSSDALISEAFRLLQNEGMRHLVLVNDNTLAGIVSMRDINKLLAGVIEDAFTQLKKAMHQLIEAEQMNTLGEFTGGITHELNQPLNVTKIICQSLLHDIQKDRFSTEDAKNDLPEIVNQMNRMSEIVAHMSVLSRPKAVALPQAYDINSLVEETLKFIRQQYKDHNVELAENLSPGLPFAVVNNARIEQVFLNILSNAHYSVMHSGKNKREIQIKTSLGANGKEVAVEVSDNGTGISDEDKPKIFQPFFTTKESGKGTGMGLLVCKKIVEEYKGRVEFESKAGEGAVFKVVLPVK